MDREGWIRFYNEAETRLSGYGERQTLGRHLFTEIAPCLAHDGSLGRIERAQAAGRLDIELTHVGDFDDADRDLRCRVQSASDGGICIFVQRLRNGVRVFPDGGASV